MTKEEIIEVIKGLSVLELNELVKACEEEFGVSAAAGVVVAAAGAGGDAELRSQSSTLSLQALALLRLRLSRLFVRSQALDLRKLRN